MATKLSSDHRNQLAAIIEAKAGSAPTLLAREVAEEFCDYLRAEARAGRLENHFFVLAEAATKEALKSRQWNGDSGALSLFEPDALLTIGEGEYIAMSRARGEHCVRHLNILTTNNGRQNAAFNRKALYLQQRIGVLFERDITLGELERAGAVVDEEEKDEERELQPA